MNYFNLPTSTVVNRYLPKNAFDQYTNSRQKEKISKSIDKITWLHKLSKDTIHLEGKDIQEIQIFEIRLKFRENIQPILNIIEKAIPYHIIFIISNQDEFYINTTQKHNNIKNEDTSVLDWTFSTEWLTRDKMHLSLNLKTNLDFVYLDFCSQIAGYHSENIEEIVLKSKEKTKLQKQLQEIERKIQTEKQFNIKVELYNKRREIQQLLERIKQEI